MSSPELSVIVPAFNEGPTFEIRLRLLAEHLATLPDALTAELIVVDDASADGTGQVAEDFSAHSPVAMRVCRRPANGGMAAALASGVPLAAAATIVVLDADLSYAPAIVAPLATAMRENGAAIALASPYMRGGRTANVPPVRLIASRVANVLLAARLGGGISTFTGMVRAYDAGLLRALTQSRSEGEFNSWAVAEAMRAGLRIVEIPALLAWPEARRRDAGRLSFRSLLARTRDVLRVRRRQPVADPGLSGRMRSAVGLLALGRAQRTTVQKSAASDGRLGDPLW